MRDNFSEKVKKTLAERVAWKCSFLGCNRTTIGPAHNADDSVTNIGEAAHIHAASPNGPRYDPSMSSEARSSISNGIWMCRVHAKMIDADLINYSAETLLQWKKIAEENTYQNLKELSAANLSTPTTLIALGSNITLYGKWISAIDDNWQFELISFLEGDMTSFKQYVMNFAEIHPIDKYIIIESQGDGREINKLSWKLNDNKFEFTCKVYSKAPRINPNSIGTDIAIGEDFDMVLDAENNDFKLVEGIDGCLQALRLILSSTHGDYRENPLLGSFIPGLFKKFKGDIDTLNRVIKIEIIRLIAIPIYDRLTNINSTPLNFINRILNVQMKSVLPIDGQVPVQLYLEWGNGELWNGEIKIIVE